MIKSPKIHKRHSNTCERTEEAARERADKSEVLRMNAAVLTIRVF